MKKLLLVCGIAALTACVKEDVDTVQETQTHTGIIVGQAESDLTVRGTFAVKLTGQAAGAVCAGQAEGRSGIETLDQTLERIGASRFERIIGYDPLWESAYDRTGINRWYRVVFDETTDLAEAGRLVAARPEIAVLEFTIDPQACLPAALGPAIPLRRDHAAARIPTRAGGLETNDPMLPYQWNYANNGPAGYETFSTPPEAGADINLLDAWSLCTGGEDITVAVLDFAVQTDHPDLAANIWSNPENPGEHGYNFWNQSSELEWQTGLYDSSYRTWVYADHGTHVAGVIAAVNNNGLGVCGIAGGDKGHGVKIMSCQIMGYDYQNTAGNWDAEVKAFEYAWKNGALIAQNSWGYEKPLAIETWTNTYQYAILRDAIDTFNEYAGSTNPASPLKGGLTIFAAGNSGDYYRDAKMYPAAYEPTIAVAATDWRFQPAYYTDYGTWVDISAPGGDAYAGRNGFSYSEESMILSTILCDDSIDFKDGRKSDTEFYGYGFLQGTSMACPHVSGVAALGLAYAAQLGKQYTADEYKSLLLGAVTGIENHLTGTKQGEGTLMDLSAYAGKMGGGTIDALKLLLSIKGTPALHVRSNGSTTIDLSSYFGDTNAKFTFRSVEISQADMEKLGMEEAPAVEGTSITVTCGNPGTAFMQVSVKVGDTEISREFALVAREELAGNGGWL